MKNENFTKQCKLLMSLLVSALLLNPVSADETCMSPYMAKIIGQEDFVYIWTLGVEGIGDGQDKMVTVDVNPNSATYGKVINSESVGGRNEAHHSGFTDDRKYLWAAGLDSNKIFIFDVHTDPAKATLVKTIDDFVTKSGGVVGPHTTYALPGRMLITALSNHKDHGGRTALVEYTNHGEYIATYWMPTDDNLQGAIKSGNYADGYGYDIRALPRRNVMLTSSFTGWSNYMKDFGEVLADPEAMKRFGNTMAIWDLHTRKPKQILDVPGAPLEIRCAWGAENNYCFTTTALTSQIVLLEETDKGDWKATIVADIGKPEDVPIPVAFSISSDDSMLWINTFMDGTTRGFDITDPHHPKQVYEKIIGTQVNMVSSSWDGKRLYHTSSLLANWDKKEADNEQFFKLFHWDGKEMTEQFNIDFYAEKLGRAHQMRFGAYSLYGKRPVEKPIKTASLTVKP
ncbi:selenium-binding protein SBP56-related protein [Pseudoalteromonas denitrificans]|uniref:Selenium-binding protein 1 n=1 Tax=Pseudoalteromonas denitrificans DSM 6059 TaxID=1123010 RepID=A0A1I1IA39_9GAMM|nr:selenium-binding protein SBP56-related protein [Pseudoalteromonas denitrificans]SFC33034.1 selenium-binding protein 1 [Pseudoalteromonas denitrificans DSM 6059]